MTKYAPGTPSWVDIGIGRPTCLPPPPTTPCSGGKWVSRQKRVAAPCYAS